MKRIRYARCYGVPPAVCALAAILVASCSQSSQQTPQHTATPASSAQVFTAFNGTVPAGAVNKQCALDIINGRPSSDAAPVADGSTVIFGGWAGNGQGQAAKKFMLVLRGEGSSYAVPLVTGVTRNDVAKVWNSKGMTDSGYNLVTQLTGVEAGTYSLYVVDPASAGTDCNLHRTITVK